MARSGILDRHEAAFPPAKVSVIRLNDVVSWVPYPLVIEMMEDMRLADQESNNAIVAAVEEFYRLGESGVPVNQDVVNGLLRAIGEHVE